MSVSIHLRTRSYLKPREKSAIFYSAGGDRAQEPSRIQQALLCRERRTKPIEEGKQVNTQSNYSLIQILQPSSKFREGNCGLQHSRFNSKFFKVAIFGLIQFGVPFSMRHLASP